MTETDGVITAQVNYVDTPPDLSGQWLIYFDETTFNRPEPVTKITRSQYEYDEGGVNAHMHVTS